VVRVEEGSILTLLVIGIIDEDD